MLYFLGNYQQKIIDKCNFHLINYIHKNKFTKMRRNEYLVTKESQYHKLKGIVL